MGMKYKLTLMTPILLSSVLFACNLTDDDDDNKPSIEGKVSEVVTLDFTHFNDREATLENAGFRVFGPATDGGDAHLDHDVEPEYVTVSADSSTAWVSLQENNGIARVDLTTNTITDIFPLGFKDHGAEGNQLDASDKGEDVVIFRSFP